MYKKLLIFQYSTHIQSIYISAFHNTAVLSADDVKKYSSLGCHLA